MICQETSEMRQTARLNDRRESCANDIPTYERYYKRVLDES